MPLGHLYDFLGERLRSSIYFLTGLFGFLFVWFLIEFYIVWGLPQWPGVKKPPVVQKPQETWFRSLGQEDPL